jgi:hypothetical protein
MKSFSLKNQFKFVKKLVKVILSDSKCAWVKRFFFECATKQRQFFLMLLFLIPYPFFALQLGISNLKDGLPIEKTE